MDAGYILSVVISGLLIVLLGYVPSAYRWNARHSPVSALECVKIELKYLSRREIMDLTRDYIRRERRAARAKRRKLQGRRRWIQNLKTWV